MLSRKEKKLLPLDIFPKIAVEIFHSNQCACVREGSGTRRRSVKYEVQGGPTDASVRFRRTRGKLEHVGSLVPQTPAVQDLAVALLEVIELQHVGRVQKPADST